MISLILMFIYPKGIIIQTKRKRGQLLYRLRLLRYRQTPDYHIRVKAHAISVSILACTLDSLFIFAEISEDQILSGRFFLICLYKIYFLIP